MTNDITTATAQDVELNDLAAEIRQLDTKLDKIMLTICEKTANGCQRSDERSQDAFLAKALPNRTKAVRKNILYAGQQILARRRAVDELDYGWSVLVEINSLPPDLLDWAYEEKRSRQQVRDKLKELKNPDDSSSPPNFFLSSDTSANDQSNDEPSDTELFECEVVSSFQSEMGTSYHGCSTGAVSMDTTNNGRADEEYDEVLELIDRIKTISSRHYRPNQPGTWSEHQWLNLTELYCTMHSIAEGYSRDYKQERRDYAEQCVKKVGAFFDTTDGSSRDRIGGNA